MEAKPFRGSLIRSNQTKKKIGNDPQARQTNPLHRTEGLRCRECDFVATGDNVHVQILLHFNSKHKKKKTNRHESRENPGATQKRTQPIRFIPPQGKFKNYFYLDETDPVAPYVCKKCDCRKADILSSILHLRRNHSVNLKGNVTSDAKRPSSPSKRTARKSISSPRQLNITSPDVTPPTVTSHVVTSPVVTSPGDRVKAMNEPSQSSMKNQLPPIPVENNHDSRLEPDASQKGGNLRCDGEPPVPEPSINYTKTAVASTSNKIPATVPEKVSNKNQQILDVGSRTSASQPAVKKPTEIPKTLVVSKSDAEKEPSKERPKDPRVRPKTPSSRAAPKKPAKEAPKTPTPSPPKRSSTTDGKVVNKAPTFWDSIEFNNVKVKSSAAPVNRKKKTARKSVSSGSSGGINLTKVVDRLLVETPSSTPSPPPPRDLLEESLRSPTPSSGSEKEELSAPKPGPPRKRLKARKSVSKGWF